MTIEEKARAYDEALKWMRELYPGLHGATKEDAEHYFPELRESEDERIRKAVVSLVYEMKGTYQSFAKVELDKMVAWLEKQKYDRMKPIYDARESFESALEKAWNDYHNGYENVDKFEDDYVECAHAKGFREGYLFGIEKQKEHKPIDYDHEMWKNCVANFEGGKKEVIDHPEKYGLQKEQKPIEKQDYSGLTDLERAILRGFLVAGVENVPVTIIKETAQDCLAHMPAEWSEEDKTMLNNLIWAVHMKSISPLDEMDDRGKYERYEKFLTSLPERFGLEPEREWSEKDETHLGWIIECFDSWKYQVPEFADQYQSAINWIKSLRPSWKPSEQEKGALRTAISILTDEWSCPKVAAQLQNILNAFEGKESRKDWKPSEEQMEELNKVRTLNPGLDALYQQLKNM